MVVEDVVVEALDVVVVALDVEEEEVEGEGLIGDVVEEEEDSTVEEVEEEDLIEDAEEEEEVVVALTEVVLREVMRVEIIHLIHHRIKELNLSDIELCYLYCKLSS